MAVKGYCHYLAYYERHMLSIFSKLKALEAFN